MTWPTVDPNNIIGVGVPPEFPDTLQQWNRKDEDAWTHPFMMIHHIDSPAPVPAKDQTRFPSKQNHGADNGS